MTPTQGQRGEAAHAILKRAEGIHPDDATIQFNLACYEAQVGNLARAKANLERATRIDPKYRLMAQIWSRFGIRSRRTENLLPEMLDTV